MSDYFKFGSAIPEILFKSFFLFLSLVSILFFRAELFGQAWKRS